MAARCETERLSAGFGLRSAAIVLGVLVLVTSALSLLLPGAAAAITRDTVLSRAQKWVNDPVPYSQAKYFGGYRTDCSGYVSMVWQLSTSYVTDTLSQVSFRITTDQLRPGDVMLKAKTKSSVGHVRMFYGWADDAHLTYVAYEQTGPSTKSSIKTVATDVEAGYIPYRYKKIAESPPPWNPVRNPQFHVWAGSQPVWWTIGSTGAGTSWRTREDTVGTAAFALGLSNANSAPTTYVEARHSAPIEAGKTYALSTRAGTTTNPAAVRLRVQVYDASNTLVADKATTGDQWGVGSGALQQMSFSLTMPAGATRALTSVRLSGSVDASGAPGGTAVFDDVTLSVTSPLPVYRFYNRKNGSHFYSASGPERDVVANTLTSTYTYEGTAYGVVATAANASPLYRFFNRKNGSHFYTASTTERDRVKSELSATYTYEGPVYNVCTTSAAGAIPVYRFYRSKSGSHFYTSSQAERDDVRARLSASYTYEGVAFSLAQ